MKQKIGVGGATPAQDSFPYTFRDTKIWVILVWDLDPVDWKLVFFDKEPISVEKIKRAATNNSNNINNDSSYRDEEEGGRTGNDAQNILGDDDDDDEEEVVDLSLAIGDMLVSEIEEIELDPTPSVSFRIYRNVMDSKGNECQEVCMYINLLGTKANMFVVLGPIRGRTTVPWLPLRFVRGLDLVPC